MKHSLTWILWLFGTVTLLLIMRHPIYLTIIMLSLFVVGGKLARKSGKSGWTINNLRFLAAMILISSIINTLFAHTGQTVLLTLPDQWILIGGDITLESLMYGVINGFVIGSLYITFNIINLALSIKQLTNLIPRAFYPVAMVITIALTFFPSIQRRAREIKEAQIIRGNPMKHISDWLPLFLPLLVTSLENAFQLSESMTARGFHIQKPYRQQNILLFVMMLGTLSIFSGWILGLYDYPRLLTTVLITAGILLVFVILFFAGRYTKYSKFQKETWEKKDVFALIAMLVSILVLPVLKWAGHFPQLAYSPYPKIGYPPIEITGILIGLFPLLPRAFINHD